MKIKHRIGVIYDTSFLMLRDGVADLAFAFEDRGGNCTYTKNHFTIERIVPEEVIDEIAGHFKRSDKEQPARHARKVVAQLIQEGAREIALSAVPLRPIVPSKLGADSETDQCLIAYALHRLDQGGPDRWQVGFIATDDGGIMYDVVKLRQQGKPIFCWSKEGDSHSSRDQAHELLAQLAKRTPLRGQS